MNILSGLFKSRDRPKNATNGSAFRFYLGNSTAGKNVSERSAMQMTAVYACVRVLSEAVAGLPLHLYKYTDKGSKEKAIDLIVGKRLRTNNPQRQRRSHSHLSAYAKQNDS